MYNFYNHVRYTKLDYPTYKQEFTHINWICLDLFNVLKYSCTCRPKNYGY